MIDTIAAEIKARALHEPFLIAIEGHGGSGKSTLATNLAKALGDALIISMDDFIIKENLNDQSSEKTGFDRARLEQQILKPLTSGAEAKYQKLLWDSNTLSAFVFVPTAKFVIIEGIAAYHPSLERYYDYKIWVDTPTDVAKARGHARDAGNENFAMWDIWAANDLAYQKQYHPELRADSIYVGQ